MAGAFDCHKHLLLCTCLWAAAWRVKVTLAHPQAMSFPTPSANMRTQGQGGRGKPGTWRERPVDSDAEAAEQDEAIYHLVQEARRYYDGPISAAHDFFRFDVKLSATPRAPAAAGYSGAGRMRR